MTRRDTPKPPAFSAVPSFAAVTSDRFGDQPKQPYGRKNPQKVKREPVWGGAAPPGVDRGYTYRVEDALPHVGTAATSVERFDLSHPEGAYASKHRTRRPHEYDWMDTTLSPARYSPDVLKPTAGGRLATSAPRWRISGGPPKMKPLPMEGEKPGGADLMYTLPPTIGKQPTSGSRTAFAPHFNDGEKRMEYREFAPLERNASAHALLRKSKRGLERGLGEGLSPEEREMLIRDIREERELGARSVQSYMPPSSFDSSKSQSKSQSYSFGRSASKRGLLDELPAVDPIDRAVQKAAAAPPPPFGGRMGAAFRTQPKMTPGPGDYTEDEGRSIAGGAFDGTGKLKLSKSSPAVKMLGKVGEPPNAARARPCATIASILFVLTSTTGALSPFDFWCGPADAARELDGAWRHSARPVRLFPNAQAGASEG